VRELLKSAGVSEKALADKLGHERPVVHRWLKAEGDLRTPLAENVRRVNRMTAELTKPEAEDYLFAVALNDNLIEPTLEDAHRFIRGSEALLRDLREYFKIDTAVIAADLYRRDRSRALEFFKDLAAVRGKQLTAHLRGAGAQRTALEEALSIAARLGFDLRATVRSDAETLLRLVRDRADLRINAALGKTSLRTDERAAVGSELQQLVRVVQDETRDVVTFSQTREAIPPFTDWLKKQGADRARRVARKQKTAVRHKRRTS
jgi:hypothetical protein